MVGAALEDRFDVIDDEVGGVVWGVAYFGEPGAPVAMPDTVCFEESPAGSFPSGGFVGGVAIAVLGVAVFWAAGSGFCEAAADDAGAGRHWRHHQLTLFEAPGTICAT